MRRFVAHTADLRVELEAPTLLELYAEGGALVREVIVGDSFVNSRERKQFELDSREPGERFFRYLRELIYLFDADNFLFANVVKIDSPIEMVGEPFDPMRHWVERQIKAVTRHGYRFEEMLNGGYRVEVIFDL